MHSVTYFFPDDVELSAIITKGPVPRIGERVFFNNIASRNEAIEERHDFAKHGRRWRVAFVDYSVSVYSMVSGGAIAHNRAQEIANREQREIKAEEILELFPHDECKAEVHLVKDCEGTKQ